MTVPESRRCFYIYFPSGARTAVCQSMEEIRPSATVLLEFSYQMADARSRGGVIAVAAVDISRRPCARTSSFSLVSGSRTLSILRVT